MIDEVLLRALGAVMEPAAEGRGAAREHRLRRAVVRAGEQMAVRGGEAPPVRRQHGGQFHAPNRAGLACWWNDLRVEPPQGVLRLGLADGGQMEILRGDLD